MGCAPACVCASPDTAIATPNGERAIASLRVGDLVYSVDGSAVKAVAIIRVKQTTVNRHHVIRVRLATGVTLEISGGHPTSDRLSFADLYAGSLLVAWPATPLEAPEPPFRRQRRGCRTSSNKRRQNDDERSTLEMLFEIICYLKQSPVTAEFTLWFSSG
jgi:hypothetical protein